MPHNLVKQDIENSVNLSLLRHRGDVHAVAKELNVPVPFVSKLYAKIRKRRDRDVSYWLANSLMYNLMIGYEQRVGYLQKYMDVLQGSERVSVSSCHHMPVWKDEDGNAVCTICKQSCSTIPLPRSETFKLFLQVLEALRKEDESLVDFADKMGYTNKEEQPLIKQNVLVVGGTAPKNTVKIDSSVSQQVEQLTPPDREKIRKNLEKHLFKQIESTTEGTS